MSENKELSEPKLIVCPNKRCQETFNNRMGKKRHLDSGKCKGTPPGSSTSKIVSVDGKYFCDECQTFITHRNNIWRHKKLCKSNKENSTYTCTFLGCQKVFMFKSKFYRHLKTHNRELYQCNKCFRSYTRKDQYESHINNCNEVFPSMIDVHSQDLVSSSGYESRSIQSVSIETPDPNSAAVLRNTVPVNDSVSVSDS